jgi:hypothetical protein
MALKECEGVRSVLPSLVGEVESRRETGGSCVEEFEVR